MLIYTLLSANLSRLARDRRGVTALEYGLVAAVLVGVITLGFTSLATSLSGSFVHIGDAL